MGDDKKYTASPEELKILVDGIGEYFRLPKRSEARNDFVTAVSKQLQQLGERAKEHWSEKNVRVWWINNEKKYIGEESTQKHKARIWKPPDDAALVAGGAQATKNRQSGSPSLNFELRPISESPTVQTFAQIGRESSIAEKEQSTSVTLGRTSTESDGSGLVPGESPFFLTSFPSFPERTPSSIFQVVNSNLFDVPPENEPVPAPPAPKEEEEKSEQITDVPVEEEEDQPDTQDPKDDIPELPKYKLENNADRDSVKHELCSYMRLMYQYISKWRDMSSKERKPLAEEVERRFVQAVRKYRECLAAVAASFDSTARIITKESGLARVVTGATALYATGELLSTSSDQMAETDPTIFVNRRYVTNDEQMQVFKTGKVVENGRTVVKCPGIGCAVAAPAGLAYTVFDEQNSTKVVYNGKDGETGFFYKSTAMCFDEQRNYIFIAGDVRVRAFNADTLEPVATFRARLDMPVMKSSLAIFGELLVMATEQKLFMWRIDADRDEMGGKVSFQNKFDAIPRRIGVNPRAVDWIPGAKPDFTLTAEIPGPVTSLCAFGKYLAVASDEYEVIYVYKRKKDGGIRLSERLIGASAGITCLVAAGPERLISGSHDKFVRRWNIKQARTEALFCGHEAGLAALLYPAPRKTQMLFSSGRDGYLHLWDITKAKLLMKIHVVGSEESERYHATCISYDPETNKIVFIAAPDEKSNGMDPSFRETKTEIQTYQFPSVE